jgi:hypothetical protein
MDYGSIVSEMMESMIVGLSEGAFYFLVRMN